MAISDAIVQFEVESGGITLPCSLLAPPATILAPQPAMLLTFGMSTIDVLSVPPSDIPTRLFAAAGHRVLSFDLPYHGAFARSGIEGIDALRDAVLAGDDPFARFVVNVRSVIDACETRGLVGPAGVVACGVSRGAYCAIEAAAADERIYAVAGIAPVTDWRRLAEFESIRDDPRVKSLNLLKYADALASRSIHLAIGHTDERVGTDLCLALAVSIDRSRGHSVGAKLDFEIHVASDSPGHTLSDRRRCDAGDFLLKSVQKRLGKTS